MPVDIGCAAARTVWLDCAARLQWAELRGRLVISGREFLVASLYNGGCIAVFASASHMSNQDPRIAVPKTVIGTDRVLSRNGVERGCLEITWFDVRTNGIYELSFGVLMGK